MLRSEQLDILQFFEYGHLPKDLQEVSKPFCELAQKIGLDLPVNPESTVALRKLLEAKDAAVRSAKFMPRRRDRDLLPGYEQKIDSATGAVIPIRHAIENPSARGTQCDNCKYPYMKEDEVQGHYTGGIKQFCSQDCRLTFEAANAPKPVGGLTMSVGDVMLGGDAG